MNAMRQRQLVSEAMAGAKLTEAQLAARWGMTPEAIKKRRQRGQAPAFVRIGRSILFPVAWVENWEAGHVEVVTGEVANGRSQVVR